MKDIDSQDFKNCYAIFSMLMDENRHKIIFLLRKGEKSVTEICEQMILSRQAVSHHLKLLKDNHLIGVRKEGTNRFYFLTLGESIDKLQVFLEYLESINGK